MTLYRQSGNALFLILIAVALFAALSYAVTQSGRGGGTVNNQQDALYAAQIVQEGADMKAAVQRALLFGTSYASLTVSASSGYPGLGSANGFADFCTTGVNCLFAPDGGGLTLPVPPKGAYLPAPSHILVGLTSYFAGAGSYNGYMIDGLSPGSATPDIPITGVGTAASDDMVLFRCLRQSVCLQIDKGLGLSSIPVQPGILDRPYTVTNGLEAACITYGDNPDEFIYYQILVAN